jgi:hypothetical protein
MLMKYASKDGKSVEFVWNSRDGVTPFCLRSKDGVEMTHVDWNQDQYLPNYKPAPGERYFIDLDAKQARKLAEEFVKKNWVALRGYKIGTKAELTRRKEAEFFGDGHQPWIETKSEA